MDIRIKNLKAKFRYRNYSQNIKLDNIGAMI